MSDSSLENPDLILFVSGNSFVEEGICKSVVESVGLPEGHSAHLAELIALTRDLESSEGK